MSTSGCLDGVNAHIYTLNLVVPADYYRLRDATFTVRVDWDPTVPSTTATQDLALFVRYRPDANQGFTTVGSSDGGDETEFVLLTNPPAGEYRIITCAFAVTLPQPFNAQVFYNVTFRGGSDRLPNPQNGGGNPVFSATTVVDPQRDVAEPSLRIDKHGNIYTCGPFGSSKAADYATKSEDGGDTFRVLGQPPEGRIAPGGGGDCEITVGTELNDQGKYTLSYTGLEALLNFSTGRSRDAGRSFIGTNVAPTRPGVDRQWMETLGKEEVYLGYNELAFGYQVQRSTDGGLTYELPVTVAEHIFRPGPIRIDQAHGIIYATYTKAAEVRVARSFDKGKYWESFKVAEGFNPNNLFPVLAIDTAGNLYSAWTEKGSFNTYYAFSTDQGKTWSAKRLVNRHPVYSTVMPWIEAGDPGRISVTYYGSEADGNIETGAFRGYWDIYASVSTNALDANDDAVRFSLTRATTHPVHWDSICVSGLGCNLSVPPGDRTLLDFFQHRIDPNGAIHIVFNQSNKVPRAEVGRIAIVTYVKQIGGPGLYAGKTPRVDPRPVVRSSSADAEGDALFPFSTFGPQTPSRTNLPALDVTNLALRQGGDGKLQIELTLKDASDAALQQALDAQAAAGSPAASLLFVVRWFSGTDPYSAVATWKPGSGFTFGFNDLTLEPQGKLQIYPGDDKSITGARTGNTITMTVTPSDFDMLEMPATPSGDPTIRRARAGDRIYDVTAFTFGNPSADPSVQSYLNQADSTAPLDYIIGR